MARSTSPGTRLPVRVGAAEQIAEILRRDIVTGGLNIGDRLPTEKMLASTYGVSGNTVREAIRSLATLGLVEVRQGSGTFVCGQSDAMVARLFAGIFEADQVTVRSVLHLGGAVLRQALLLAVDVAEDHELAEVVRCCEAAEQATSAEAVIAAVEAYRAALIASGHDPLLDRIYSYVTRLIFHLTRRRTTPVFWEQDVMTMQPLRRDLTVALSSRDRLAVANAIDAYNDAIMRTLGRSDGMLDVSLSEQDWRLES